MDDEEMRREERAGMVVVTYLVITVFVMSACLLSWGVWRLVQWLG